MDRGHADPRAEQATRRANDDDVPADQTAPAPALTTPSETAPAAAAVAEEQPKGQHPASAATPAQEKEKGRKEEPTQHHSDGAQIQSPSASTCSGSRHELVPTSLDCLARVEVQCVMHFLDRGDLSRLARCSRRMYADADQEAAWKHVCSHLAIDQSALDRGLVEAIHRGGLFFRHQSPVRVRCNFERAVDVVAAMDALRSLHHIVELRLVITLADPFTVEQWREFFHQLPLDNLLEFNLFDRRISTELANSMVDWLPRMTRLHTLKLHTPWPLAPERLPVVTQAICAMPNLTKLIVRLPRRSDRTEVALMGLVDCAHLTDLGITNLPFETTLFQQFILHLRSASQLRRLLLMSYRGEVLPGGDYSSLFAAMPQLEELTLRGFFTPPVALVRHVHHAASLRVIDFPLKDITADTIDYIRQIHSATSPHIQLYVSHLFDVPAAVNQALVAIDPKRVHCRVARP